MKKYINPVLVFVAVAALVVATVEFKRLRAAAKTNNDATAAVLERNAAMKARLDSLKPASSQPIGAGADESAKIAAQGKAAEEKFARWKAESDEFQKREAELAKKDPEFVLKRAAAYRANAEMINAPFVRVHNLSKEQSETLADAEFQKMLRRDDMETVQGMSSYAIREAMEGVNDEFASNVKAALGDDLYEQFSVYERQRYVWNYVGNLGSVLSLVDMPLSVKQASQLADAIANASFAFQQGRVATLSGSDKVDWDAVDAAAVNFLTPEQMDVLKNADVGMVTPSSLVTGSRHEQELNNAMKNLGSEIWY